MNMRVLKLICLSLVCAMALAQASLAQGGSSPSPIEGTYGVTANSAELGAINFVLILKRDGGKWKGEIKDSPTPLTITSITIDETNKITIAADAEHTSEQRVKDAFFIVEPNRDQLTRISQMIDAGELRVFVGAAFPLQEAGRAYAQKPVRGKNVLVVDR